MILFVSVYALFLYVVLSLALLAIPRRCRGPLLVRIPVTFLIALVGAWFIAREQLATQRRDDLIRSCSSNLKQLHIALTDYANDHEGTFPDGLEPLYPDYIQHAKTFFCPRRRLLAAYEEHGIAGLPEYAPAGEMHHAANWDPSDAADLSQSDYAYTKPADGLGPDDINDPQAQSRLVLAEEREFNHPKGFSKKLKLKLVLHGDGRIEIAYRPKSGDML